MSVCCVCLRQTHYGLNVQRFQEEPENKSVSIFTSHGMVCLWPDMIQTNNHKNFYTCMSVEFYSLEGDFNTASHTLRFI